MDWQAYTALGVVLLTLAIFVQRLFRRSKSSSACGHDCGCEMKKKS